MNQSEEEEFSTQKISPQLVAQIVEALRNKAFGSIEIYIENYLVTQITERTITKLRKNSENRKALRNFTISVRARNNNN